jgi:hypothetical protein
MMKVNDNQRHCQSHWQEVESKIAMETAMRMAEDREGKWG